MEYINNDASLITLSGPKAGKLLQDISCVDVFKASFGHIVFCNKMGKIIANGFYQLTDDSAVIRVHTSVKDSLKKIFTMYAPLYGLKVSESGHPLCSFKPLDNFVFNVGDYYEALSSTTMAKPIPESKVTSYLIAKGYFEIDDNTSEKYIPNYVMPKHVCYTKGCFVGQEILARLNYKTKITALVKPVISDTKITLAKEVKVLKHVIYANQHYYLLFAKNPKELDFIT